MYSTDSEIEKIEVLLLLEGIYRCFGFDFRNYSSSYIKRRIQYRMRMENFSSISALQEKVLHDRNYLNKLVSDFSINVTSMFRDPEFFRTFRSKVVPLLHELPHIRIWHAGCSTGEEVYSMAILLYEEGMYEKVRIYATDMSDHALQIAKSGTFPLGKMKEYTNNYIQAGGNQAFSAYYIANNDTATLAPFLSEKIFYAQHNLVTDGSFNEFHVIICRNVLLYFNRILQSQVHDLLYHSLCSKGVLGLGKNDSMNIFDWAAYYDRLDSAQRIFRKIK